MKLCPRCSEPYQDDAGFCPIDGSALVRSTDPLLGRTLAARYRLVRRIGSGGMAVVYLARHVMIERMSAIKILRQDLGINPSHRERFLREARAVNRINHPNIVEITDFGESDGLVFLVMEYVGGESLLAMLRRGRFAWSRAARVAVQIASALGRAHELGVIHRDLKPENVLIIPREGSDGTAIYRSLPGSGDDFVKLTDFGIAKIVDAPTITFNEQRFGTPGYIAPEYLEGGPAGAHGDIYALGVVLYEMLTGHLPFEAKSPGDLLVAVLSKAPVPPSARVDGIPAELEELVLRLIARRPDDRPRDAFAVHEAIADILRRLAKGGSSPPGVGIDGGAEAAGESGRDAITTRSEMAPISAQGSARSELTAELAALPTAEIAARWHGMLSDLMTQVAQSRRSRGEGDAGVRRAAELAEMAADLVAWLERAKAMVAEHQAQVDRLEARGRAFRQTLGRAIDVLSRDRSRERAHLSAVGARRDGLLDDSTISGADRSEKEARVWESAALEAEEARARQVETDLTFQIESLERQLDEQNEQLESDLAEATGKLEGALTALRRMTSELVRTIEEASASL
jgi:serine/threonine protein kinase